MWKIDRKNLEFFIGTLTGKELENLYYYGLEYELELDDFIPENNSELELNYSRSEFREFMIEEIYEIENFYDGYQQMGIDLENTFKVLNRINTERKLS